MYQKNKDLNVDVNDSIKSQAVFGNTGGGELPSEPDQRKGNRAFRRKLQVWKHKRNKFGQQTIR